MYGPNLVKVSKLVLVPTDPCAIKNADELFRIFVLHDKY